MKTRFLFFAISCFSLIALNSNAQNTIVKTVSGFIKGEVETQSVVFKGIPYAQPPVGALRFKAPQPAIGWHDTLTCNKFGSVASQYDGGQKKMIGSEDCLTLNLYKPITSKTKLPVMIWIHGGGMTNGAGMYENGHAFSDQDGIIAITINYRLGAFGFTYLGDLGPEYATSGNNGLLDCIMALKWVKQNISSFGGDPKNVTVMGQSAGAKLVSTLSVTQAAKGYYKQLVIESGGVQCIRDTNTAKAVRQKLLNTLNINQTKNILNIPAEELIEAQAKVLSGAQGTNYFGPVDDGVIITDDPYNYLKKNHSDTHFLIGTTKEESLLFMRFDKRLYHPDSTVLQGWYGNNFPFVLAAYKKALIKNSPDSAAIKVLTQYMYQMHNYRLAGRLSQSGNKVWMYRFDYDRNHTGATHSQELPYVWYRPQNAANLDSTLIVAVHKAWVSFIKTGDPNAAGLINWPTYNAMDKTVMIWDDKPYATRLKFVYDDNNYPTFGYILNYPSK